MNISSLVLVGLEPNERKIATEAARLHFPQALVTDLTDLDELAHASPHLESGLVVCGKGTLEQVLRTIHVADESGLPRWAMLIVGEESMHDAAGFVPRNEWTARSAAQAFRSTALHHAARIENARLRGDLRTVATRFSHDVRSPLGAILTTCELIKELGEVPDETLLRAIVDSAEEVSLLVGRLTAVLRATADPRSPELLDMGDIVFRSLQRIQYECHEKKVSVVVPEKWPSVVGVAKDLEVVWDCLLANAMKFGGDVPQIRVGWKQAARDFEFWVEDGGQIPPGLHEKLFLPFHQLHKQNDGGGLELSIVKRIVELHDGRCLFEPLPQAGSRFLFTIPIPEE